MLDPGAIRALELIGHRTWPSLEDEWRGGWLLRSGGGVTRRSNSASVVDADDPILDLDERFDGIEEWFRARGLPPIFRLTGLARRGWTPVSESAVTGASRAPSS